MKKFLQLSVLCSLLLGATLSTQAAYIIKLNDIDFDTSSGSITAYNNVVEKDIEIPSSFTLESTTYKVKRIETDAFRNKELAAVKLPVDLVHIGKNSFRNNQLTSLEIPNTVTVIEEGAFMSNKLETIVIPSSVTTMGRAIFNDNQITSINGEASQGIVYAHDTDGNVDNTTINSYGGTATVIDFIPATVNTIGELSFFYNKLTAVTIPNTVTSILHGAFKSNLLSSIVVPSSVTELGEQAFYVNKLTSLELLANITVIKKHTFGTNLLTRIDIPDKVEVLEEYAFYNNKLTSVDLSLNLTSLKAYAFYLNDDLNSITLPNRSDLQDYRWVNGSTVYNGGAKISSFKSTYNAKWTDTSTSINSKQTMPLNIYPNPGVNYIFIENAKNDFIEVFDLTGNLLIKETLTNNSLDISRLSKGLYIIKHDNRSSRLVKN